ncbi:hypothetical protein [Streptacidiphilus neutrinimicus]|uniref:hypothetical protein n=1 Tax=Streptacidiphilus neutrinimicus TaxID=105420 RepID=UPI000A0731C4|nr:hypothetical protein [Streptacidiphilus neutrinimicus]
MSESDVGPGSGPGSPSEPEGYCPAPAPSPTVPVKAEPGAPVAACVLCDEPTEYAADTPGLPTCPRCAWQQAQRGACSG